MARVPARFRQGRKGATKISRSSPPHYPTAGDGEKGANSEQCTTLTAQCTTLKHHFQPKHHSFFSSNPNLAWNREARPDPELQTTKHLLGPDPSFVNTLKTKNQSQQPDPNRWTLFFPVTPDLKVPDLSWKMVEVVPIWPDLLKLWFDLLHKHQRWRRWVG